MKKKKGFVLFYQDITLKDVAVVGGKNASLGEMMSILSKKGVRVPDGFALTSYAFWYFVEKNNLYDKLKKIFDEQSFLFCYRPFHSFF